MSSTYCQGNPDVIGTPEECTATAEIGTPLGRSAEHTSSITQSLVCSAHLPLTIRSLAEIGTPSEDPRSTLHSLMRSAYLPLTLQSLAEPFGARLLLIPFHSFSLLFILFRKTSASLH